MEEVVPVQLFHAEREQFLVLGFQFGPQFLHVVVAVPPTPRAEIRQHAGKRVHLLVQFHHAAKYKQRVIPIVCHVTTKADMYVLICTYFAGLPQR